MGAVDGLVINWLVLQYLGLASNALRDEGALLLAEALRHNASVNCLDVSSNAFGEHGVCSVAKVLAQNHTITTIDLSSNQCKTLGNRITGYKGLFKPIQHLG